MKTPLLSILIPTVVGREDDYERLVSVFNSQIKDHPIEMLTLKDDKQMTIGEKRERLYNMANGFYSVQWDDDDSISDTGIADIIQAINSIKGVDCVVYPERCLINGVEFKSNHSILYDDWEGDGSKLFQDGYHFHRTPFFKSLIRTDIAKSVSVPKIRWGEDHEWSKLIKPLLHTQSGVLRPVYHYIHNSTNPTERYGLDRS
jgi:hypothetical protein